MDRIVIDQMLECLRVLQSGLQQATSTERQAEVLRKWLQSQLAISGVALVRTDPWFQHVQRAQWPAQPSAPFTDALDRLTAAYEGDFFAWTRGHGPVDAWWMARLSECGGDDHLTVRALEGGGACMGFILVEKDRQGPPWNNGEQELLTMQVMLFNRFYLAIGRQGSLKQWLFDDFLNHVHAGIYISDVETDQLLYMNETMKRQLGIEHPEGLSCWQVLQRDGQGPCTDCPVPQLIGQGAPQAQCTRVQERQADGRIYENYDCILPWLDGRLVHFRQAIDVTSAKQAANLDELTGLLNRRAGKEALQALLDRGKEERQPVTVCMYDINLLKQVNDTYGHPEGDAMLVAITQTVRQELGERDLAFRLSGDEFILAIYACDEAAAAARLRGIRRELMAQKQTGRRYEMSFCYGLLEVGPEDTRTLTEVMTQVDEQMYIHKRAYHRGQAQRERIQRENQQPRILEFSYDKEHLYEALIRSTENYIYICNMQTNLYHFPASMVAEFDLPGEVVYDAAQIWGALIHEEERPAFFQSMQDMVDGLTSVHDEQYRVRNRVGAWVWVHCRGYLTRDEEGEPVLFAGIITRIPDPQRNAGSLAEGQGEAGRLQLKQQYNLALQNSYTEIYEYDLADNRLYLLLRNTEKLKPILYSGKMEEDLLCMMKDGIHPEDRQIYWSFYDRNAIQEQFSAGSGPLETEYRRMGMDGQYHWVNASIVPMTPPGPDMKAMILIKDVTERRTILDQQLRLERRYNLAFRQSCDVVVEVDLDSGRYTQTAFKALPLAAFPTEGDYETTFLPLAQRLVHPNDLEDLQRLLQVRSLRTAYEAGCQEEGGEYRILGGQGDLRWMDSRIYYIYEERPLAIFTIRDITQQKEQAFRETLAERYDAALRNIYDELYELNVTQNTYQILYHVPGKYVTPPEQGVLSEGIADVAAHMVHPEDRQRFLDFFTMDNIHAQLAQGKECLILEARKLWQDGRYHWASLTVFAVPNEETGEELLLCFIMDIDDKKRADWMEEQNRLLRRERAVDERYRIIVEQTDTLVFEWNLAQGTADMPDKLAERLAGRYDGRRLDEIWLQDGVIHPEDVPAFRRMMAQLGQGRLNQELTARLLNRQGDYRWCKMTLTGMAEEQGKASRLIGTLNDVDEATKSIQTLKYRAEFDGLTGIYNMEAFCAQAQTLLGRQAGQPYALIRMDISRFKFINDLFGLEEGDRLLRAIAQVIQRRARPEDAYGRVGGDTFCLLMAYGQEADILRRIEGITQDLSRYQRNYQVVPYFGICLVDDRSIPVSILCDWANLALQTVKGSAITSYAFYDDNLRAKQLDEQVIEGEMVTALNLHQFAIYLQPKHDIATGRIVGAEALVRWLHPQKGVLAPDRFIPLFERNGFILQLDAAVWEAACQALRRWLDAGYPVVPISINVSRLHIYNPDVCDTLVRLAEQYRLPHGLIELEVTESLFIEDAASLYRMMSRLREEGFRLSMDDFGAGYSSLNMLKNILVNTIKLDREFLNETVTTAKGRTVIQYTVAMAKELQMQVVPEGVETREQADFLLEAGCTVAQGFYFSKPMPISDFEQLAFGDGARGYTKGGQ